MKPRAWACSIWSPPCRRTRRLTRVSGSHCGTGEPLSGYEIHLGVTDGPSRDRPFARIDGKPEGAVSADGRVMGTYLHGVFSGDRFRSRFLQGLGVPPSGLAHSASVDATLEELAAHLEAHVSIDALLKIAGRALP